MKFVTRKLIDDLFKEHGVKQHDARFAIEALSVMGFIVAGLPVDQALATLGDERRIEEMRTFMYTVRLRMVLVALTGSNELSEKEAEDLHKYLRELATIELGVTPTPK